MSLSPGSYEMGRHKQCISTMIYQGHNKVISPYGGFIRRLQCKRTGQKPGEYQL